VSDGALDALEFSENSESLRKFGVTAWRQVQFLDEDSSVAGLMSRRVATPFDTRMRKIAPFNRLQNKGALGFI